MGNKKEPYEYADDASDEMLISLLLTHDGRGVEEKRRALLSLMQKAGYALIELSDKVEIATPGIPARHSADVQSHGRSPALVRDRGSDNEDKDSLMEKVRKCDKRAATVG